MIYIFYKDKIHKNSPEYYMPSIYMNIRYCILRRNSSLHCTSSSKPVVRLKARLNGDIRWGELFLLSVFKIKSYLKIDHSVFHHATVSCIQGPF